MDGMGGLHRWQWLFLLLGIPVVLLGLVTFFFLENIPETVHCKLGSTIRRLDLILIVSCRKSSKHIGTGDSGQRPSRL